MPKVSAGLLLFRRTSFGKEVLLVHPGGPFFARKDAGHWTIPKGEPEPGEELLATALREFAEETSLPVPAGEPFTLGAIKQVGGKTVHAFALEGDIDVASVRSNSFEMEWPPRSGRRQTFPEVDRASWFPLEEARTAINEAQRDFLDRLAAALG